MFEHSEEGNTDGLGWFEGQVKRFLPNQTDAQGGRLKVPHMGWNTVRQTVRTLYFKTLGRTSISIFVHKLLFLRRKK